MHFASNPKFVTNNEKPIQKFYLGEIKVEIITSDSLFIVQLIIVDPTVLPSVLEQIG